MLLGCEQSQARHPTCFQIPWVREGIALTSWLWGWAQTFTGDGATTVAGLVVPGCWIWGLLRLAVFALQLLYAFYATERCVTWECCRKVIWQPKLPFSIHTFKVKVATLKQSKKLCLMGKKRKKKSLLLKKPPHTYLSHLHAQAYRNCCIPLCKWFSIHSCIWGKYKGPYLISPNWRGGLLSDLFLILIFLMLERFAHSV